MAVKIRLRRMGAKKNPFYRIIVADSRTARNGRFIEEIGYYAPLTEPKTVRIDEEKAKAWLEKGATPTATVMRLLKNANVFNSEEEQAPVEAQEQEEPVEEEEAPAEEA